MHPPCRAVNCRTELLTSIYFLNSSYHRISVYSYAEENKVASVCQTNRSKGFRRERSSSSYSRHSKVRILPFLV